MKNGRVLAIMISDKIALLDSNVVAGIIAVNRDGNSSQKTKINSKEWERSINKLISLIDIDPTKVELKVPTPICYELMAWDKEWFKIVTSEEYKALFIYSSNSLGNKFIKIAARYAYESQIRTGSNNDSPKLKTMDPAAYSIMFAYPILTENECDFPTSHFDVIGIDLLNLVSSNDSNKQYRNILYLLKPKEDIRKRYSDLF